MKLVPKRRVDLTECFDKVDLGVESIGSWSAFEKKIFRGKNMKFLDANIFIYAYYKPKKQLSEKENQMKEQAQKIISNVSKGKEDMMITVVHISEVVNILKHGMPQDQLIVIIRGLFMLDNVKIADVTKMPISPQPN